MGDQSKKEENAVFIGNLKKDASKDELKNYLFELFNHHLKIGLNLHDIEMKGGKKNRAKFAFIHLNSKSDRDKAINMLHSRNLSRVSFDFSHLVDSNQIIRVGVKNPVVDEKADIKPKLKQQKIEKIKSSDMKTKLPDTPSQHIQQINVSAKHIHGNSENMPVSGGAIDNHDNGGNVVTIYYEDQLLGNETRDKEFKLGGGELILTLKKHVSTYLCGFLNSSQKGTLYIGVEDSGAVKGIKCDQPTEDKIRLRIDETVKTFKPALFPQKYHVDFIPVYMKDGTLKKNFKVLQITVDKVDNLKQLYQADGKAYMRRDGSVEVLDPSYIQDWCKQIHQIELQKQQEENVRNLDLERNKILSEKEKEKKQIQEKKEEEISKLEEQITEVKEEEISKLKKQITEVKEENVRNLDLERNKILSEKEKEKKQIQEKKEEEISKLKKQITEVKEEEISQLKKQITEVKEENARNLDLERNKILSEKEKEKKQIQEKKEEEISKLKKQITEVKEEVISKLKKQITEVKEENVRNLDLERNKILSEKEKEKKQIQEKKEEEIIKLKKQITEVKEEEISKLKKQITEVKEENVRNLDLERNKILSEKEKEKKQIQEKKEEEISKLKKQITEVKEEEISKLKKQITEVKEENVRNLDLERNKILSEKEKEKKQIQEKKEEEISKLKKKITVVEEENKHLKKNKSKVCVLM